MGALILFLIFRFIGLFYPTITIFNRYGNGRVVFNNCFFFNFFIKCVNNWLINCCLNSLLIFYSFCLNLNIFCIFNFLWFFLNFYHLFWAKLFFSWRNILILRVQDCLRRDMGWMTRLLFWFINLYCLLLWKFCIVGSKSGNLLLKKFWSWDKGLSLRWLSKGELHNFTSFLRRVDWVTFENLTIPYYIVRWTSLYHSFWSDWLIGWSISSLNRDNFPSKYNRDRTNCQRYLMNPCWFNSNCNSWLASLV